MIEFFELVKNMPAEEFIILAVVLYLIVTSK